MSFETDENQGCQRVCADLRNFRGEHCRVQGRCWVRTKGARCSEGRKALEAERRIPEGTESQRRLKLVGGTKERMASLVKPVSTVYPARPSPKDRSRP
ncbi:hypothetical protein KM043_008251 [Ampulex compressa]|nr:hypothetical protein KM043_008251 [Ampulex compressa]